MGSFCKTYNHLILQREVNRSFSLAASCWDFYPCLFRQWSYNVFNPLIDVLGHIHVLWVKCWANDTFRNTPAITFQIIGISLNETTKSRGPWMKGRAGYGVFWWSRVRWGYWATQRIWSNRDSSWRWTSNYSYTIWSPFASLYIYPVNWQSSKLASYRLGEKE